MSTIQWTNETWNPVTGCSKVSQGCKNCYAERIWPKVYGKYRPFTDVRFHEDRLLKPLSWKSPRRVFVNSMSDLFHESVSEDAINKIFTVMALSGRCSFQILTKRPQRMLEQIERLAKSIEPLESYAREIGHTFKWQEHSFLPWPIPNVWLGVSVEDQRNADERIPLLLKTPAAIHWISAEPLIGPIHLNGLHRYCPKHDFSGGFCVGPCASARTLDWVVVGGESGALSKIRPFDLRWAYDIVNQCKACKIPVFVKQLGHKSVFSGGSEGAASKDLKWKDSHGGNMDEWPEDLRIREFPA